MLARAKWKNRPSGKPGTRVTGARPPGRLRHLRTPAFSAAIFMVLAVTLNGQFQ